MLEQENYIFRFSIYRIVNTHNHVNNKVNRSITVQLQLYKYGTIQFKSYNLLTLGSLRTHIFKLGKMLGDTEKNKKLTGVRRF